jgi:hypothetical protein
MNNHKTSLPYSATSHVSGHRFEILKLSTMNVTMKNEENLFLRKQLGKPRNELHNLPLIFLFLQFTFSAVFTASLAKLQSIISSHYST